MKKNLFFGLFATMMLLLTTACQKENDLFGNGEATISFEISTPQMATRAFSDGTTATVLKYAVYHKVGENFVLVRDEKTAQLDGKKAHVDVRLATGKTYYVFFWAQHRDALFEPDYDALTMKVIYNDATKCNDENYDAFYWFDDVTVEGAATVDVTLTRPFAQLNIGTNDLENFDIDDVSVATTAVTVKNVYDTFNFASGNVVGNATEVTFAATARPASEAFPVTGYEYLAMNYMFVQQEGDVLNEVIFTYDDGKKSRTFTNIPVKPNHRTNIYGALLTNNIGFDVEIEEDFDGDAVITDAEKLIVAAQTGGTYTLTDNITLTEALNVTAEFTLNLGEYTISNPNGYVIENTSKLTINSDANGGFEGLGGIRSTGGEITINGGKYTASSDWKTGTYNHILKAENTDVVINGGTFDATIGGTNNAMINVSEGSIVTINAGEFRNVAANEVIPQFAPYMFTYEKNGKLIINGGNFYGGWRFNGETTTTDIYGGNFTVSYDGQSFHANSTHVLTVYGGVFSLNNGGKLNPTNYVAAGYVAVNNSDNTYSVVKGSVAANAAEFIAAVNNIEDGDVIALSENVNFTADNRTHNSGNYYDGLYYIGDKDFTIDLGGKTIGNANGAVNDYLLNFKNDGTKANTITIKNGTIDAGTAAYCAICTSSTSAQPVTINLENVNIINNNSSGSTIKVRGDAVLNVKEGTVITGTNSYLGIECIASTANIYEGAKIYMNGTSSYNGCLVGVGGNGTVNVYGGYGKGVSGGLIAMTSGGTINARGGEWIANTDGTYANGNKSVLVAQSANNKNSVVNVTGGTYKGGYNCYGDAVGDAQINISGGNFNADPSSYLADGKSATENDGVWTVQ